MKGIFQGEREEKRRKSGKNNKKYGILLKEKKMNQIVIKRTARERQLLEMREARVRSKAGENGAAVSVPRLHTLHHALPCFA